MGLPYRLESSTRIAGTLKNRQGPRSEEGKTHFLKHGILASTLLITKGEITEGPSEFDVLLSAFKCDLLPLGTLEEVLVERIAICCWRQKRVLRCEAGLATRNYLN